MKTHLLLIGFSCTGKTSLGREVFGERGFIDSDVELRRLVAAEGQCPFAHIYEIYVELGRKHALSRIEEAENALIENWASDPNHLVISLGPGFPLRANWANLRDLSHVVLFRRSPEGIYRSLKQRREEIFRLCPEAKEHDNWDIGIIVDEQKTELSKEDAIRNIREVIRDRERYYQNNDGELDTDEREFAKRRLLELRIAFESRRL